MKLMIALSQFENHHLQIQEAGVGILTGEKQIKVRECHWDAESRHERAGKMKSRKASSHMHSWDKRSGTCNSFHSCCVQRQTNPSNSCTLLLEAVAFTRMNMHTLEAASECKTRPGWVFTPPVALISGNFRQISSCYWVSEGDKDWH